MPARRATVCTSLPLSLVLTLLAAADFGLAQTSREASKPAIRTQTLTIQVGDAAIKCYFATPSGEGPFPGILLIHEWWGLNDWVKQQAERFAEKGYAALAVDLYRGQVAADAEHAHELMRGLPDERALADMRVAFEFLSGHKFTRDRKIGVIGWCMGGGHALRLAIAEPKVAATVICYGRPVNEVEQLKKIKGSLLGIWGGDDRGIEVAPFELALKKAGTKVAGHEIYKGAGHAFMNPNNKTGYNKQAADRAWGRIDDFFDKELK